MENLLLSMICVLLGMVALNIALGFYSVTKALNRIADK